jgi:uncharacterized protein (TIGR03435 family)
MRCGMRMVPGSLSSDVHPRLPPPRPAGAPDGPTVINGVSIDPNGPSLLTAIQEQLGLKLEPSRTTVDAIVVDHLEHPSEN